MKHVTIPQLAAIAGCTRARMHQIFQDGGIRFPRIDSGKQARYADTPEIRKWAVGLKERREAPGKIGRRQRVRGISASDAVGKAAAIMDAPDYIPDVEDRKIALLLAEGFAEAMWQRMIGKTGPETAFMLGYISLKSRPRVTGSGFACGHPTQTGNGIMRQFRLKNDAVGLLDILRQKKP